ncbi:unnamed protein product, partial [Mesorhabditis belari]|uniref:Uncharacterized protein n=1 Tax=Mesorhabditis belari TaxID=2138241 RepID=A0AAF3FKL9_9BILA
MISFRLKKMIKVSQKLKYCYECNKAPINGETLLECANYPRSFHPRCCCYPKVTPERRKRYNSREIHRFDT